MMAHFVRVLGHVQASNFHLVKAHATNHFPDNIWDYGAPDEYLTEPFESMHVQLLKIGYRGSNHRDAIPQVLNSYRRRRALRRRQGLDADDDKEDDSAALPAGRESIVEKVRHEPGSSITPLLVDFSSFEADDSRFLQWIWYPIICTHAEWLRLAKASS
jgi:hypothetical protein